MHWGSTLSRPTTVNHYHGNIEEEEDYLHFCIGFVYTVAPKFLGSDEDDQIVLKMLTAGES